MRETTPPLFPLYTPIPQLRAQQAGPKAQLDAASHQQTDTPVLHQPKKGHASVAPINKGHTSLESTNTGRNTVRGRRATKHNLRTRFLQNFRQRLSLPIRSNSRARFSYGAKPATSRTTSRTNLTRVLSFCRRALAARISEQDDASQWLASATPWFYDSKQLHYLLNGA